MKKVGIIANPKRPHAADFFERMVSKTGELGWSLFADRQTAVHLPGAEVIEPDRFADAADAVLALGGDGTVLFAARVLNGAPVPVLGVNLGSLGFLTGVGEDRLEEALDALSQEACEQDVRTVADCTLVRDGNAVQKKRVLNDAVIGFGGSSRIAALELAVDGMPAAVFSCDGMILTTPTGSTGHFLASGGPIIQPCSDVFGISVICPHTLSNRPIILPDSSTIEITVRSAHKTLLLAADGQDVADVAAGDRICFQRSARPVTFLRLPGYSYFSVLRQKLHWRGRVGD